MRKSIKRTLVIMLAALLCGALLFGGSLSAAAYNQTAYPVWVAGIQVTSDNMHDIMPNDAGKISYTPPSGNSGGKLTLDGVTLSNIGLGGEGIYEGMTGLMPIDFGAAIYAEIFGSDLPLEIEVIGHNFIELDQEKLEDIHDNIFDQLYGINVYSGSLVLSGGGSLDMTIKADNLDFAIGISASRGFVQENGTYNITVTGQNSHCRGLNVLGLNDGTPIAFNGGAMNMRIGGTDRSSSLFAQVPVLFAGGALEVVNLEDQDTAMSVSSDDSPWLRFDGNYEMYVMNEGEFALADLDNFDVSGISGGIRESFRIWPGSATYEPEDYGIWVNGELIMEHNKDDVIPWENGQVSLDPNPAEGSGIPRLYLDNVFFTSKAMLGQPNLVAYGIYAEDDIEIYLIGENNIISIDGGMHNSAIQSKGSIYFMGDGTLNATAGEAGSGFSSGISATENLYFMNTGEIHANGSDGAYGSYGIWAQGDLRIENSRIVANADNIMPAYANGVNVEGDIYLEGDSYLDALPRSDIRQGLGIYTGGDLSMEGGTLLSGFNASAQDDGMTYGALNKKADLPSSGLSVYTSDMQVATPISNYNSSSASYHTSEYLRIEFGDVVSESPFDDVPENSWFYEYVTYVYGNGIMNGVSDDDFDPEGQVTRAMMTVMLHRIAGEPGFSPDHAPIHDDLPDWAAIAIGWAATNGIAEPVNGIFGANDFITREELAIMTYRYAEHRGFDMSGRADLSQFTDEGDISDSGKDAVSWLVYEGVMNGTGDGKFSPLGYTNRAQISAVIMRIMNLG